MSLKIFHRRDLLILAIFLATLGTGIIVLTAPVGRVVHDVSRADVFANADNLKKHVIFLSTLNPGRGFLEEESLGKTVSYIEQEFERYCDSVEKRSFAVEGQDYQNVVCVFDGGSDERIIVGAHYDTAMAYSGADDNASGVSALLELARMIATSERDLAYRTELVAYALEEPPFFSSENMGSFVHAKQLRDEGVSVRLMIALDMLGYFSDEPNSQMYPSRLFNALYPSQGNFIAIIGKVENFGDVRDIKRYMREVSAVDVRSLTGLSFIQGANWSDHRLFWRHDFPAIFLTDTSWMRNPHYHQKTDTYDTLNYEKMTDVVTGLYWSLAHIE